jgi:hypothetical protein
MSIKRPRREGWLTVRELPRDLVVQMSMRVDVLADIAVVIGIFHVIAHDPSSWGIVLY